MKLNIVGNKEPYICVETKDTLHAISVERMEEMTIHEDGTGNIQLGVTNLEFDLAYTALKLFTEVMVIYTGC
jgi:hypothetical protein